MMKNVAAVGFSLLGPIALGVVLFGVAPRIPVFYVWSPLTEMVLFAASLFLGFKVIVRRSLRHAVLIGLVYFPLMVSVVMYLSLRIAWGLGREFP